MATARELMRMAVDLGKKSIGEERRDPPPRVGVVFSEDGEVLGSGFRGDTGSGDHAEYGVLKRLGDADLSRVEVFTTLEPCSRRDHPKLPCAERLAKAGVRRVWIGMYDPNPRIYREGWKILRDAGVELRDFDADLRAEIAADNAAFLDGFRIGRGPIGEARFDWSANSGRFEVHADNDRHFATDWSGRGDDSMWAYDERLHVAEARHASDFAEIDDPAALNFSSRAVAAKVGEIVVYRDGEGAYLLVRIEEVHNRHRRADRNELFIQWELRTPEHRQEEREPPS